MARRWRAWHPAGASAGVEVRLGDEEAHHVVRVLRLRAGEPLDVFDGRGREWEGTLLEARREAVVVRLGEELGGARDPAFPVLLVQGLGRPERVEWVLEKATEVGAAGFLLTSGARSEAPPSPSRLARWRRIVLEACKQSGRRRLPELQGPMAVGEAAALAPAGARIVLQPGAEPLALVLPGAAPASAALAVGPEGGWTEEEVRGFLERGFRAAGLGPRALRTETAGPVAAALILHRWGDLGTVSPANS